MISATRHPPLHFQRHNLVPLRAASVARSVRLCVLRRAWQFNGARWMPAIALAS
jgi:hypothetical protein